MMDRHESAESMNKMATIPDESPEGVVSVGGFEENSDSHKSEKRLIPSSKVDPLHEETV